ncbi:hypothetical protein ABIF79_008212 [Bradyrhizobium japonicum]
MNGARALWCGSTTTPSHGKSVFVDHTCCPRLAHTDR